MIGVQSAPRRSPKKAPVNDTPPSATTKDRATAHFWEGRGREYEDLTERSALRRLLPAGGRAARRRGLGV